MKKCGKDIPKFLFIKIFLLIFIAVVLERDLPADRQLPSSSGEKELGPKIGGHHKGASETDIGSFEYGKGDKEIGKYEEYSSDNDIEEGGFS